MDNIKIQKEPIDFKKTFAGLGAVAILLIIGTFAWFFMQDMALFRVANDGKVVAYIQNTPAPLGELYLTLTPKSGGSTDSYVYDFELKKIRMIADTIKNDGNPKSYVSLFHSFGRNGVAQTYVGETKDTLATSEGNIYTLFFKKNAGDKEEKIISFSRPPMGPSVLSPNNQKILYTSRSTGNPEGDIANSNELTINLAQREENGEWSTRKLRDGTYPQWITNDIFYYLKNDGIYIGTTNTEVEEHIWETKGILGSNSRLSISNDGKYLAWALPPARKVIVFESGYDEELGMFVLNKKYVLKTSAFWLTFSPDSTKLAMQAVDWNTLKTNPNPRIEIYSMNTGKKDANDINLDYFVQTAMFLTDWR